MSAFEEPGRLEEPPPEMLDETLKRMVKSPRAAADFGDVIMERAEQLPPPRDSWWRRLGDPDLRAGLRPPRMMAVVWVGMLVCCIVGLSYTYQQLTHLQAENRQPPNQMVVVKRSDSAAPSSSAPDIPRHALGQAERDALSQVTIDVKQLEAGESDRLSWWNQCLRIMEWMEATASGWWAELKRVWAAPAPDTPSAKGTS